MRQGLRQLVAELVLGFFNLENQLFVFGQQDVRIVAFFLRRSGIRNRSDPPLDLPSMASGSRQSMPG
jgi:hypothetical protein